MMAIAVLISGNGSNLKAILDYGIDVGIVISDNPCAFGLEIAKNYDVKTLITQSFIEIDEAISNYDLIALAGFMRIIPGDIVRKYYGKIINIHPSLLPAFPGLHTHSHAILNCVKISGCTVHIVDDKIDHGPIIAQSIVFVSKYDTEQTLKEKVLQQEHVLYSTIIDYMLKDEVKFIDKKVVITDKAEKELRRISNVDK